MIKLALIGYGAWGPKYLKTIDAMDGVEVSFVCRRDISKIPVSVKERIRVSWDYRDAILDSLDGVIIATPPSSHREITSFFLGQGVPVILEKPVAETYEDTCFIMDMSRGLDIPVLVDNIHLFSPSFLALRDSVKGLDNIHINSVGGGYGPFREYSSLIDWGPHDVAMILSIFQRYPDEVSIQDTISGNGHVFDIKMKFGDSTTRSVVGNGMNEKTKRFSVSYDRMDTAYDGTAKISGRSPLEELVRSFIRYLDCEGTDWRFNPQLNQDTMKILLTN